MKPRPAHIILLLALTAAVLEACRKPDATAGASEPYALKAPAHFPAPTGVLDGNPPTQAGFELGRRLFYDGNLARDGMASCASCHQQFAAFSTFEHPLSHGVGNQSTTRNAPGIFNLAWHRELHWDGGIAHLEVQPLAPLTAPNEMGETVANVVRKLNADPRYREMFRAAFGTPEADSQRMLKALAQFMALMVSADAKYDRVMLGRERFTQAEEAGYAVFKVKCAGCHREPLFTDLSYRNTGLAVDPRLLDAGRMRITRNPADSLKFKVPGLRNVLLTAPYGHDGRFPTIGSVLQHYRAGVQRGPTTDPLIRNGIAISAAEGADLASFLATLTDTSFTKDPRFSDPR